MPVYVHEKIRTEKKYIYANMFYEINMYIQFVHLFAKHDICL